jgi:hypothetical protein
VGGDKFSSFLQLDILINEVNFLDTECCRLDYFLNSPPIRIHLRDAINWIDSCFFFKLFKSVHHRTIQVNHQPDATIFQFIILTFVYSSACFGRSPAHHQELNDCSSSLWFYLHIVVTVVLCSWSDRPAGPTTNTARLSITTIRR